MTPDEQNDGARFVLARADVVCVFGPGAGRLPGTSPGALNYNVADVGELDRVMRDAFPHSGKRVVVAFDERVTAETREAAKAVMEQRHHSARMSKNTIEGKTIMQGRNILRNLRRLETHGFASALGQPLAERPVFLVGAGPSLEKNRNLLDRARRKGAVVCVNTASKAIPCDVDAVVAVESLDVSQHIHDAPRDTLYVIDMHGDGNIWDAAERYGRAAAVFPLDPPVNEMALRLGCMPLASGCAAATMAMSLCTYWGASEFVLVGMDLAWTSDGTAYAEGTVYDDITVKRDGDRMLFGGESKRILDQHVCEVQGYGGGPGLHTSFAMEGQVAWFANATKRVKITNATEGGARIPGTHEEALSAVLDRLPDLPRPNLPAAPPVPAWAQEWQNLHTVAREVAGGGYVLSEAQRRLPIISLWILPAMIRLQSGPPMDPAEYHAALMEAIRGAANDIARTLEESR